MPEQITQQQLQLMADIIGGLMGQYASQLVQAPAPQTKDIPQEEPEVPESPYSLHWHKGLPPVNTPKGPKADEPHALSVKPPKASPVLKPSLAQSAQKPSHTFIPTPDQDTQAPTPQAPDDQHTILENVKREAQKYDKPDTGTNLAHWLRTHNTNRSVVSQFEAAGVEDLDTLAQILNHEQPPQNAINLTQFHDDTSPFTVLSQPKEDLSQGGIPAVVVGPPYAGQVHTLEEAFPGVHFMTAEEAAGELEEAASTLAKPLPIKSIRSSPYGRKYHIKDEDTPTPPTNQPKPATQSKPKKPPQTTSQEQSAQPTPTPKQTQAQPDEPVRVPQSSTTQAYTFNPDMFLNEAVGQLRDDWQHIDPNEYTSLEQWADHVANQIGHLALEQGYSPEQMMQVRNLAYQQALLNQEEWSTPNLSQENYGASTDFEPPPTETGKILQSAKAVTIKPNHFKGKSGSYIVDLEGGTKALFKPAKEEDKEFRNKPDPKEPGKVKKVEIHHGTFYLREIAASDMARELGLGHLIPEAVLRDEQGNVGSMQAFRDDLTVAELYYDPYAQTIPSYVFGNPEQLAQAATLDYLFGNSDRHQGNWGIDHDGNLILVDHGLCFPEGTQRMRYGTATKWGLLLRRAVHLDLPVPDLSTWQDKWPVLENYLRRSVNEKGRRIGELAIQLTEERFHDLLQNSGKPFRTVPVMNSKGEILDGFFF